MAPTRQGERNDKIRANVLKIPAEAKWTMLQQFEQFQEMQQETPGGISQTPEHWINVLNVEPTTSNIQDTTARPLLPICRPRRHPSAPPPPRSGLGSNFYILVPG